MRKAVVVAVAFVISLAGIAGANLLSNPGLEIYDRVDWDSAGWYNGTGGDAHSGTNGAAYSIPEPTTVKAIRTAWASAYIWH